MDKKQFLNKIEASFEPAFRNDLRSYFSDYKGPYDNDTAQEYIRYFTQYPGDISRNATQGVSHRQSLIENGMFRVNHPFGR
jgi:hypothetical protein